MRLLNSRTYQLKDFFGADLPPYAILSHTWGDEEVSMLNVLDGTADRLDGYRKLIGACEQARLDGIGYVWIDTCCIDKGSTVELTEAINSMFTWYRNSLVCYAYLKDVDHRDIPTLPESDFSRSRWFTRGWTLQELIAPARVVFYASDWSEFGTRSDLAESIARITGIDRLFFQFGHLSKYSIAQRMSWASKRQTSRIEDQAYCLLGLLGVNMPMLYGEGSRAFIRLQEEIMKHSDDQSLFAWSSTSSSHSGFLALSPADFAESGMVAKVNYGHRLPPYSITNQGVQITIPIIEAESNYNLPFVPTEGNNPVQGTHGVKFAFNPTSSLLILNCGSEKLKGSRIGIFVDRDSPDDPYYRSDHSSGIVTLPPSEVDKASVKQILIRAIDHQDQVPLWAESVAKQFVVVESVPSSSFGFRLVEAYSQRSKWIVEDLGRVSIILSKELREFKNDKAVLFFQDESGCSFCLIVLPGVGRIMTNLLVDLHTQGVSNVRALLKTGAFGDAEVQPLCRKKQKTGVDKTVIVSVTVDTRPHGSLVRISMTSSVG